MAKSFLVKPTAPATVSADSATTLVTKGYVDGISLTPGPTGPPGATIWTTTTAPTTPNYTFTTTNLVGPTGQAPKEGDIILYSYYRYRISSVASTTVVGTDRVSIRGSTGAAGSTWKPAVDANGNLTWSTVAGTPESANIKGQTGETGPAPEHQWVNTTKLQFKQPNNQWGSAVELKGAKGDPGSDAPATPVVNALNSTSTTSALSAAQGKALNEGKAANTEVIIVVKHGTSGSTARPVGASVVYWVGSAEPANALNDDMWLGEES